MEKAIEILTLTEASGIAKVSKNTLRAHILSGILRAANVGLEGRQHWRILRSDLLEWVDRRVWKPKSS